MKIPPTPHRWALTPKQAIKLQKKLAPQINKTKPTKPIRFVVGTDLAFTRDGQRCIAAAVIWDMLEQKVVEQRSTTRKLTFPYVPGLLSFREAPTILAALRLLRTTPDAIMCDGHGLAHPRRFGIACHIGLITGLPSLGCGKSRLTGTHQDPKPTRGSKAPLVDDTERIGTVLRTRDNVKPVYISIGHNIDLPTAEQVALKCAIGYRLPEPTRLADQAVARIKREM